MNARDVSGPGGGMRRIDAVFNALGSFVEFLIGMDDMVCSLAVFNDAYDIKLRRERADATLGAKLEEIRANTHAGYGGRYLQALESMQALASQDIDIGVLLSDGEPTESRDHGEKGEQMIVEYLGKMRQQRGPRCILHTVGFGDFAHNCLRQLAFGGGGEFHAFKELKSSALRSIFRQLSGTVSTLRSTVLTFGEQALKPLPPREKEPEDAWMYTSAESASDALWAWPMLPSEEAAGDSGGGGSSSSSSSSSNSKQNLMPRGDPRKVLLHRKPFAEGALRYAFHLFLKNAREDLHLVCKESKFANCHSSPQQVHHLFLENHRRAEAFANAFNSGLKSKRSSGAGEDIENRVVQFVSAYVLQLSDPSMESGFRYVIAERYIPGTYIKLNGNDGYVNRDVDANTADVAAAFSHFSFENSGGAELCVDIQGVGRKWTDPQLHSRGRHFGPADLGEEGMRRFFRSHECSECCCSLGLRTVDPGTLELGTPAQRAERSACTICMDAERTIACRPCGHFCFCDDCGRDAALTRKCPICRQDVESVTRLALSGHAQPPSTYVKALASKRAKVTR